MQHKPLLNLGTAWLLATALGAGSAVAQPSTGTAPPAPAAAAASCAPLLQRSFPRLQDEAPQALCQYAGKVLLVVNTASYCGFTKQYEGLEALQRKYAARGLVVLGFPSNDFGEQEPKSNAEIAAFCENTFNVKFPMFAKSVVKPGRPDSNPLFVDLARATDSTPKWNFHKYLVDRQGKPVEAFLSTTAPDSERIAKAIEKLL